MEDLSELGRVVSGVKACPFEIGFAFADVEIGSFLKIGNGLSDKLLIDLAPKKVLLLVKNRDIYRSEYNL